MTAGNESLRGRDTVYASGQDLGPEQSLCSCSLRLRSAVLGVAALLYAAMLVFLRGRPMIDSDAGIFVSVASRVIHGAHLYTGVWDNKPPFFYYAQALAVGVAGWRGVFLLDVVWLFVAAFSMWLLLGAIRASTWTRVVGSVLYPVFLTGVWYWAGYSELPPLALATTMAWLCFRGNMVATGALLAIAPFFRLDYGLVFLSLIGAAMIAGRNRRGTLLGQACRLLVGLVAAAAASLGVLAGRGELAGYVSAIKSQLGYPHRALTWLGEPGGIIGHVKVAGRSLFASGQRSVGFALVAVALVVILIVDPLRRRLRNRTVSNKMAALNALFVSTAAAVAITLALTALWDHGLEMIALPATFGTCVLVSRLEAALRSPIWRLGAIVAAAGVCSVAFGGIVLERSGGSPEAAYLSLPEVTQLPSSAWWRTPYSVTAAALNRAAARVRHSAAVVTYARLGENDDGGYAGFTNEDLQLACPQFHQYPWSSPNDLTQTLACVRNELPRLVLVSSSFQADRHSSARQWDSFVLEGEQLLRKDYRQSLRMSYRLVTVEVWVRR